MVELIKALRCSAQPYVKDIDCTNCKYRLLEPAGDLPVPCDLVIDGVEYYESCDVDRMANDAADELEKLLDDGK